VKENIEKIFLDEIREKKRAGTGIFSRKGHGVKHGISGALKTPFYYMKTKERNKLNGEVEVSNMYSTILNWDEWNLKDKETQKKLMIKWREIYSNTKIMEQLQVGRGKPFNAQSFADIVNHLGCPAKIRGGSKPRKNKSAAITTVKEDKSPTLLEFAEVASQLEFEVPKQEIKQILITRGLHLEYNGEYDPEQLSKILTKLQLLIEGEPNKFKISLSLSECE
jgi:hypothetical protein